MVSTWLTHSQYRVSTWWTHSQYMVSTWWVHGEYLVTGIAVRTAPQVAPAPRRAARPVGLDWSPASWMEFSLRMSTCNQSGGEKDWENKSSFKNKKLKASCLEWVVLHTVAGVAVASPPHTDQETNSNGGDEILQSSLLGTFKSINMFPFCLSCSLKENVKNIDLKTGTFSRIIHKYFYFIGNFHNILPDRETSSPGRPQRQGDVGVGGGQHYQGGPTLTCCVHLQPQRGKLLQDEHENFVNV